MANTTNQTTNQEALWAYVDTNGNRINDIGAFGFGLFGKGLFGQMAVTIFPAVYNTGTIRQN